MACILRMSAAKPADESGSAGPRGPSLDLSRHMDKMVHVKLAGGRQIRGVLKGYDPLVNLVLDDVIEELRGALLSCVALGCFLD